ATRGSLCVWAAATGGRRPRQSRAFPTAPRTSSFWPAAASRPTTRWSSHDRGRTCRRSEPCREAGRTLDSVRPAGSEQNDRSPREEAVMPTETTERADLVNELLERIGKTVGQRAQASAVYGEPVEREGLTVIPVAKARFGFGGGGGAGSHEGQEGSGGG